MKLSDFDYELPSEAIAQEPCNPRDASRLMVLGPGGEPPVHLRFRDLPSLLRHGDLLVVNDTRVLPARIIGRKKTGGRVELLLLRPSETGCGRGRRWTCLLNCSKNPRTGDTIDFKDGLQAEIVSRSGMQWDVELLHPDGDPEGVAFSIGRMPLPPYIRRGDDDPRTAGDLENYQTVYARQPGAVAAPTAGLHFTRELLDQLAGRSVDLARLTLHVGPGTFLPVREEQVKNHVMHSERYDLPPETAEKIGSVKRSGGRVVAVGTTVVRTLESCSDGQGGVVPGTGSSSLFIYPGYRFEVVDAMVTNFHLPRSTLLMLVSAFMGRREILQAYSLALREGYRFYSYGDAMFLRR